MKLLFMPLILLAVLANSVLAAPSGRIFITNERSDSVSVINGSTLEVEATIEIGERPRGIGLSPDGAELYIAVSEENKIKVVDPVSLKIIREFEAGSDPETFAVHPNGNIYISNEDDAKATVFNPKTGEQIAEIKVGLEPEGVAISPDGKRVIITSESTNMLHVITVPGNTIENNILIGSRPRAATFSQSGDIAYATAEISGEVVKVDMINAKIIKTGSTGDSKSKPKDVVLSKDEKVIYVAGGRANKIIVMDADTLEIIKGIPVGKRTWGLAMSKDGKRLFTTDGVSSTVSVIDTDKNEVIKTIEVGKFPWGVVIND
ncbi:MAG TPA: PQQ-dependent catabolism-associated beta-propeller protein [Thiotrichaceae bacterium]|jgi:PQQ-dependent catabolism-associated beta-propeller protein|nr:PQQ-dependent catabolism-associated beta-propeller protein [Thiotrichaceae bacterium]HIM07956.1 PQQ-dependent catabolism-associated beta-propeller protein [Gammaproteobacteria bacterium]